ncbi:MAG TPA: 16S rRNA (guanine(966)-N(2))-methyltransferase RsmD [Gammaproteobacteria bacterium]|nr:16S rRNA (guanine(966)-N(2))-methyltransferase RsmD [Gammaproteobacteria bacterium]
MKSGSCRIIAGRWRGRKIRFDGAVGLRPTTDRIRETVFNWLQPYLYQCRCLDVFAGSGVLGFEALSRGAAEATFIESNKQTAMSLRKNTGELGATGVVIHNDDALQWLLSVPDKQCFNLVFLDPPFHSELLEKSAMILSSSGILADDAIIYVEHGVGADISLPENWSCIREKRAGQVSYRLFTPVS